MKVRVIFQGLLACVLVWTAVFAAQEYFRSLRLTAETVEEVVEEADLRDWSEKDGEPTGQEAAAREEKIREVAELISKLDFPESGRMRQKGVTDGLFSKLSPGEKDLFVKLAVRTRLELFMTAFDSQTEERREKFLKKTVKELEYEFPEADLGRMQELMERYEEPLVKNGIRATLDGMSTEEVMALSKSLQITNELMQRMRMPNWEGRGGEE